MKHLSIIVKKKQEEMVPADSKSKTIAPPAQPQEVWRFEGKGQTQSLFPVQYTKVALLGESCSVVLSTALEVP